MHYQCDYFEEGTRIFDLHIYAEGKLKEFSGGDEAAFIKRYADRVHELMDKGLVPVHWNQNRPHYGPDHINSRFEELTGEQLGLDYINDVNLAELLKDIYGPDYIADNYNRLNRLAELNHFYGVILQNQPKTSLAHSNRAMLLLRIYNALLNDQLITDKNVESVVSYNSRATTKTFSDFLLHAHRDDLARALRDEFSTEKSKKLRYMIEALERFSPPLVSICFGERKAFYQAMRSFFEREVGTYNSIFDCQYIEQQESKNVALTIIRIQQMLTKMENK